MKKKTTVEDDIRFAYGIADLYRNLPKREAEAHAQHMRVALKDIRSLLGDALKKLKKANVSVEIT